ncbi:MAG: hypothetical protein QOG01_814 [Pseudonocardiales bacterium]|jgi:hypothetical protein|nr:hypothetical protein [Pseudonocardiales bacterium]
MGWRILGDVMVGAHFAFLGYLIVGGFIAWRWPWTIYPHILAVIWGALIIITKVPCPLTALQNQLRERGGQQPLGGPDRGFIAHYVRGHLYPIAYEHVIQATIGLVVLGSWVGFAIRMRHRSPAAV